MKKMIIFCTLVCLVVLPTFSFAYSMADYQYQETRELVSFVVSAAEEIEKVGEEAFPQFREKGGKWFRNDSYVFVWGLDGMRYVYPPDLSGEGKNMLGLEDINGKPIGRMIVEIGTTSTGEGWLHYQWPRPGGETPVWKSTFVKTTTAPSGRTYLVGSGKYDMGCERIFLIDMVNRAISLLEKEGLAALDVLRSKSSEFIFSNSYIFIKDNQGNELFNAAFPELEGTNIINLEDVQGKYFVREVLNILKTEDNCWIEYMWPKPGETEPSKKLAYEKKMVIDDFTLIVGASYYPESPSILGQLQQATQQVLDAIDQDLSSATQKISLVGLSGIEARDVLIELCEKHPYVVDACTVNQAGIMTAVEPPRYREFEGSDISEQEHVMQLHQTRKPVLSKTFQVVEGFKAVVLEHPIFSPQEEMIGSLNVLIKPELLLETLILPQVHDLLSLDLWVMQPDGLILYDPDVQEIGRNLFSDPLYQPFTQLRALGREIALEDSGSGSYQFFGRDFTAPVTKKAFWATVGLHGSQWRLVITRVLTGESSRAKRDLSELGLASPILIGALYNLTGAMSSIDTPALKGALLAVKHLNAKGGISGRSVRLLSLDTKTDPEEAASAAHQLVTTGVVAGIGYGDTTYVLAAAPVFQERGIPFLTSGATDPHLPERVGSYMFLTAFGDDAQAYTIAEYLYHQKSARTAWVLTNEAVDFTRLLSEFFKERFKELAGPASIVREDSYTTADKNFSTQISNLQALSPSPDILFVSAIPEDAGVIVRKIRQGGILTIIASGDGFDTPLLIEVPGSALADNIYFSTHQSWENPAAEVQDFIGDYIREYGCPPDTAFAALGYDAVMLLARAMKRADSTDPEDIRKELAQEQGYQGVTGLIAYKNGSRVPHKSVAIIKVEEGQFHFVTTVIPRMNTVY